MLQSRLVILDSISEGLGFLSNSRTPNIVFATPSWADIIKEVWPEIQTRELVQLYRPTKCSERAKPSSLISTHMKHSFAGNVRMDLDQRDCIKCMIDFMAVHYETNLSIRAQKTFSGNFLPGALSSKLKPENLLGALIKVS